MSALQSHRYCSFKPRQRSGNAWVTVLVVLGILVLLVVLFMPATRNAREAARRSSVKTT